MSSCTDFLRSSLRSSFMSFFFSLCTWESSDFILFAVVSTSATRRSNLLFSKLKTFFSRSSFVFSCRNFRCAFSHKKQKKNLFRKRCELRQTRAFSCPILSSDSEYLLPKFSLQDHCQTSTQKKSYRIKNYIFHSDFQSCIRICVTFSRCYST